MKKLLWMLGFAVGMSLAVGCEEPDDSEGVLFACGDDMCLSSEEQCIVEYCTPDEQPEYNCVDLPEAAGAFCEGDQATGITCSYDC